MVCDYMLMIPNVGSCEHEPKLSAYLVDQWILGETEVACVVEYVNTKHPPGKRHREEREPVSFGKTMYLGE